MSALTTIRDVAAAGGGTVAVLYPFMAFTARRAERRRTREIGDAVTAALTSALDPIRAEAKATGERVVRIEAQFGPNGGGMREQINVIAVDVRGVRAEQVGLARRFDDHMMQAVEDRRRLGDVEHALLLRRSRQQ